MKAFSCLTLAVGGCSTIALLLSLTGCKSQQPDLTPSPKFETGYTFWESKAAKKDESISGIDFATIDWGNWNDDLLFAVWVNRKPIGNYGRAVTGGRTGPGRGEATYSVSFRDSPEVKVECRSTDGKGGSLTVNGGQPFDLSQGRLFLVRTAGGEVRVKQLKRDGLSAKSGAQDSPPDCFVKLKDDPEVTRFFAKGAHNPK